MKASQAALANHTVYCGTKGALDSITKVMALEFGPHNIRVNCVNPTVVMTNMGRIGWSDPAKADPMKSKIPLGRFAGKIIFLFLKKATTFSQILLLQKLTKLSIQSCSC